MTKPANHIHRYQRTKIGKNYLVYRCMLPGCPHYIRRELLLGRLCNCYRCSEDFIITKKEIRLARPHCGCVKKSKPELEKFKDMIKELEHA